VDHGADEEAPDPHLALYRGAGLAWRRLHGCPVQLQLRVRHTEMWAGKI